MEKPRAFLASDMDGTVIPPGMNPDREAELASFRTAFEAQPGLGLAYVTGRDLRLALEGIHRHRLPIPDFLACDVGTSLYQPTPSGFQIDREYLRLMKEARGKVDVREVQYALAPLPGLQLQPQDRQTESKMSYFLSKGSDHQEILASVQETLAGLGGNFQAVYSVGLPSGIGLLDLLPSGVAKDFALRYLCERTGVEPDSLVYAGDSGNDMAAMLAGFHAIVVGNATPNLKEELAARGGELGLLDKLYFAEGLYAAGVMEGCRHFGIL